MNKQETRKGGLMERMERKYCNKELKENPFNEVEMFNFKSLKGNSIDKKPTRYSIGKRSMNK